jgi:phosphocarrier protein
LAGNYRSRIIVNRTDGGATADARSIFGLLALGASAGVFVDVETAGDDADEALAAVTDIVQRGFGEI